jgi:hypothetical protein
MAIDECEANFFEVTDRLRSESLTEQVERSLREPSRNVLDTNLPDHIERKNASIELFIVDRVGEPIDRIERELHASDIAGNGEHSHPL